MIQRIHIVIRGAVQGVGFRPFVYRLASEMSLPGWVLNSAQGVFIEVEGPKDRLDEFVLRIEKEKPPRSFIQSMEFSFLDSVGFTEFEIRTSDSGGEKTAIVLPDIATCSECLREIFDPLNRRYLYPFTNCTNCGPRFTIIEALPYDRPNTSMKKFTMCLQCAQEYNDPLDRRFHAQPNACLKCGPRLELWSTNGDVLSAHHDALMKAAAAIRSGEIVAVKGLGGFHLMVDARNDEAVRRLRERKHREEKPFALMYPSLQQVKSKCDVSKLEERLLLSPEAPIVLMQRKDFTAPPQSERPSPSRLPRDWRAFGRAGAIALSVAPNNPCLGVMLPYTPLHHVLMKELGFPIVATSGNVSDEPICTDEREALQRLRGIADLFLTHNRPIVRHVDDSIVRVMMGRELVVRRARGFAPLPVALNTTHNAPLLAVGAHLKNTIALSVGSNVFISQHIGDLETKEAYCAFERVIADFKKLYSIEPQLLASDLHPDYLSTKYANSSGVTSAPVQHHYAHVASCMADNQLEGIVLGVSWDGTGYGTDGTVWGGEFLLTNESGFERVGTLRPFKLPGGERAIKEPRRTALGLLYEIFGDDLFSMDQLQPLREFTDADRKLVKQVLKKGINAPFTTSVGRLFDAVASIIGIRQRVNFEGQAAMEMEFAATQLRTDERYEFRIPEGGVRIREKAAKHPAIVIDWTPMILEILEDRQNGVPLPFISAKFHNTLTEMIVTLARHIGENRIVLTGGCFQNKYLTERTVRRLTEEGFRPYWHQRVPPNDGGIALGQVYAACIATKRSTTGKIAVTDDETKSVIQTFPADKSRTTIAEEDPLR